ncbi:MAG: hypothetical protein Q8916_01595 [Bacteroidota bacterium]|nr:hypothetical protein [Bacteroidota bacterium]MDP4229080.1 hypothetical protein [Bacteroidota bacterium]MDP4235046.1 hypothetical protein [Bacteroidota bacterium]
MAILTVDENPQQIDRNPKFKRRLAIGIAIWVFLMFLFLAFAIAIDWH